MMRKVFSDVIGATFNLDEKWERCEFSQGWKQRMGIVRTLLRKGRVWVFDEATSGVDKGTHERLVKIIFESVEAQGGGTVVFVTHHGGGEELRGLGFGRVVEVGGGVVRGVEVGGGANIC